MLPVGRVEAGCGACHQGERSQPGAPNLNDALTTLERAGCYSCHMIPGWRDAPRRGPDLRRISSKLRVPWVRRWLENPRALKPATWMPRFWPDASSAEQTAEIEGVVAYLFTNAEEYRPAALSPPHGDAGRGKAIVESVGCLGCHIVGDAVRDTTSVRRTFGQPLEAIGAKTTYWWLYDWVKQPSRFNPSTRMPDFRLTDAEAADIATYFESLTAAAAPSRTPPAVAPAGDDMYRQVIRRRAGSNAAVTDEAARLSGEPLRVRAGREVIQALRCFNCHEIRGFDDRSPKPPIRSRRSWSEADIAALHAPRSAAEGTDGRSAESLPLDFGWGSTERERLALALTAIAGPTDNGRTLDMPWHRREAAGRAFVAERNCIGCHVIEGIGGDLVRLAPEPSLGPPLLTPEGARVQRDWLRGFLRQPRTIRPWLSVRMPTFAWNDSDLDRATEYFWEISPQADAAKPAASGAPAAAGKELFDLLKCQQCHVLGTVPKDQPTANLAPDLRMAHDRLQPAWILAWLRNPSAILPGTRMPTFWPDYPASFYPPLNRNAEGQVRALQDYVIRFR
jgi:mono/diheme cytochrome c family protein